MGILGSLLGLAGAPFTGGLSLIAGMGMDQMSGQREANEQSLQSVREQMQFQERMSSTAYQRAMKDMQAAGLNPMLAFQQGGASSPGGSSMKFENVAGAGMAGASQAAGMLQGVQQIQQSQAMVEQTRATTDKIRSETLSNAVHSARATAEAKRLGHEADIAGVESWLREGVKAWSAKGAMADADIRETLAREKERTLEADVRRARATSQLAELDVPRAQAEGQFYEGIGKMNPYLRALLDALRGGHSAARLFGR